MVLNVAAPALDGRFGEVWSGALRVVTLGTELVVWPLGGKPGWKGAPPARPRLLDPFLVGDRLSEYCGEVTPARTSSPLIKMSPEVGVGWDVKSGEFVE